MEENNNLNINNYEGHKSNLEELLKENIKYSRAIFADTQKIRRYMMWRMIFNIIWLVLFFAPLILAMFWLPQFISNFVQQFQGLTGGSNTVDLLQQLQQLK